MKYGKLLILSVILLASVSACENLLGVRDVEKPDGNTTNPWIPATQGDKVFTNLESVFSKRSKDYYLYNFFHSDSSEGKHFRFVPSPASQASYPGKFDSWTLDNEYAWFSALNSLLPADSTLSLSFSNIVQYSDLGDSLKYEADYTIRAHLATKDLPGIYSGHSYFTLIRDSDNTWVILYWEDINSTGEPDWSMLKAQF